MEEFYLDDNTWSIRYLVVNARNWLSERKVLISPQAVNTADWTQKVFPVNGAKEQVEKSPDIDTEKPVSLLDNSG